MREFLELVEEELNACHELFWHVVMKDVHVDSLVTTSHKSSLVLLLRDALTNSCNDQGSREDGLEVASGHLKNNRVRGWHH